MSAIAKLMKAREEFHKREIKKSGENKFAGFKYLELGDFLIPALEIFASLKLAALTSFTKELATMTITDLEDGTSVQITSPFGSAALKACHEVQNIGAVETYQRRYLWVAALEIVEHDALDSSPGAEKQKPADEVVPPGSTPHSGNDEGKALWLKWQAEGGEMAEYMKDSLAAIVDFINVPDIAAAAKKFYSLKDQEEMMAVWSQLPKARNDFKKFKQA